MASVPQPSIQLGRGEVGGGLQGSWRGSGGALVSIRSLRMPNVLQEEGRWRSDPYMRARRPLPKKGGEGKEREGDFQANLGSQRSPGGGS